MPSKDWLREQRDRLMEGTAPDPPSIDHPAPTEDVHNGFASVGRRLDELSGHVQSLVSTWRVQERHAVQGRTELRDQMESVQRQVEDVRTEMDTLRRKVEPLIEEVAKMRSRVDDYWDSKQRVAGGWKVLTVLGAIAGVIVGAIVALAKVAAAWFGSPHHP